MKIQKKHITGYILAGGKSSRMGQDKGHLLLADLPMTAHIIRQMNVCVDEIIIVSGHASYHNYNISVIPDIIPNVGPVGGIFTALSHSCTPFNLIVSCDTPFITSEAITHLIRHAKHNAISFASVNHQKHPLFGLYPTDAKHHFRNQIENNQIRLQKAIENFPYVEIKMDEWAQEFDIFRNINTPEDYLQAKKILKYENIHTGIW